MPTEVKLALYKASGRLADRLIRCWTKSDYSHCELLVNGVCFSSSMRDGGVRAKRINLTSGNWDVLDVPGAGAKAVWDHFRNTQDDGYSYLDLLRCQVLRMNVDEKGHWFCSEWCAAALGFDRPNAYSPQDLFVAFRKAVPVSQAA